MTILNNFRRVKSNVVLNVLDIFGTIWSWPEPHGRNLYHSRWDCDPHSQQIGWWLRSFGIVKEIFWLFSKRQVPPALHKLRPWIEDSNKKITLLLVPDKIICLFIWKKTFVGELSERIWDTRRCFGTFWGQI